MLAKKLERITRDLEDEGISYALIGGIAVGVWTTPRFTKDIDLAIAVANETDRENLIRRLQERGYYLLQLLEHAPTKKLCTVRLCMEGAKSQQPDIDLLFCSSGIEQELVQKAVLMKVLEVEVLVARIGHLLALKVLAYDAERRAQDQIDIIALLKEAKSPDITDAKKAVALIQKRGFNRGKDLRKELQKFLKRYASC